MKQLFKLNLAKRLTALISIVVLVSFVFIVKAMDYTRTECNCCHGARGYYTGYCDYYGNPIWMPCQCCGGYGYILVPSNNSSNFQSSGVSRLVTLRSEHGGVTYGTGTFYEGKNVVVIGGVYFKVSNSDSSKWNYMILFDKGQKWYFD